MKKTSRYIILIVVLILFAGLAPRFLLLEQAKDTIAEQLSNRLGTPITIEKMRWEWLPFPHLLISDTGIIHDYYEFSAPEMMIYPNWRIIFDRKLTLGKIHLKHPEIHINEKAFNPDNSSKLILPELNVYINKGVLKIDSGENYKDVLPPDTYMINEIDGVLTMAHQKAEFNFQGSTPFIRNIKLGGDIDVRRRHYQFFLDLQNIKLHKSMAAFFQGHLIPVSSNARLAGTITGTGLQRIEGNLHGTLPSFKVSYKDREILLAPGYTNITLLKSDQLLQFTINDLEMKEPQIRLSGLIERKGPSTAGRIPELQPVDIEPTWTLDLNGNNLDLTAIRHKILTLWGDNKTAKTVCGVVLSGKAASAAYRFFGKAADFKRLEAMIIEADVRDAEIHVPEADLYLTGANGPILIKDSILTGYNLSARLGNSLGSRGDLLLSLAKAGKAFSLDIDIDADLKELPPVLERLVAHDGFQRELAKFRNVNGRASGNLHLGETLHNITTMVRVDNMHFQTDYEPIPETVFIDNGYLHVGPKEVDWREVTGRIGRQEVMNTSGNVIWQTGEPLLHIEKIQGHVDGNSLYAMLEQTGKLPDKKVRQKLSELHGIMEVAQGTLKGPAGKPLAWEYQLDVKTHGLSFTTPLLPEPATIHELSAEINDKEVKIQHAEVAFLGQPLSLSGTIRHTELENWHGAVQFNGPLQGRLADWITTNGWFGKLQPRIPCTMENLTLGFQNKTITLSGTIHHGISGNRLPMARIDLESSPEYLRIKDLTFLAPGEQGNLTLDLIHTPAKSLTFSWQGFVNADTIAALFQHSPFIEGTFGGAFFQVYFSEGKPGATQFKGLFRAENLLLKGRNRETNPIIFKNILLSGIGKQLNVPSLSLTVGSEGITGQGYIVAEQKGLQLDLDLASSHISNEALDDLVHDLKETQRIFVGDDSDRDKETGPAKNMDITGRIGFDFDSYSTNHKIINLQPDTRTEHSTLIDMHGELQLGPGTLTKTEIFSSKLCNLDFEASWFSDEALEQHFELASGSGDTLLMENVFQCLGLKQDLLEGEFSLKANLKKESGVWNSGNIYIKSHRGRILRFKLLSRIFKIVNITDLFVTQAGTTGKKGFPFSRMDIDAHIYDGSLIFDRAILYGEGLNLFLGGSISLADYDTDLTLLIAPFKTVDALVSIVPLIGPPIMKEYESLLTIPVAMQGPLPDPMITPLHPKAVGGALFNFVKETFKLPYNVLVPHDIPLEEPPISDKQ